MADRRRRDAELIGRRAKAACLGDGDENDELGKLCSVHCSKF